MNSEYITGVAAFPNRTDSETLRPFLRRPEQWHRKRYRNVAADAGYESLDNYLYSAGKEQTRFIKPIFSATKRGCIFTLLFFSRRTPRRPSRQPRRKFPNLTFCRHSRYNNGYIGPRRREGTCAAGVIDRGSVHGWIYGKRERALYLLFAHGIGAVGGIFAKRRHIAAGAMVGALILVVICNLSVGYEGGYPQMWRVVVQIGSGLVIGSRFTRSDVRELRILWRPLLLMVVSMFALNVLFAFLVSRISSVTMMTALFSYAPGGVADLALVAADFGVDVDQVTLLQLARFVFVVTFFPMFVKRRFPDRHASAAPQPPQEDPSAGEENPLPFQSVCLRTALSALAAACGGLLFRQLGVPAGAIIGAILFTAVATIATDKTLVPSWLSTATQICAGIYIGVQLTRQTVLLIGTLVLPALLIIAEALAMAFLESLLIWRLTGLDKVTSLFSCVPGGIVEMGLIADEMGLDTPKIVAMHAGRIICVICVLPILIDFLAR